MMNNDDDNDVDYDNHPDSMIVIVDDGVNAIGWESYNNVDNHDDDDPYTIYMYDKLDCRADWNTKSARSAIYSIFSASGAYFDVSRQ